MTFPKVDSYSSVMMTYTTLYRNRGGLKTRLIAEVFYFCIGGISIAESAGSFACLQVSRCRRLPDAKILDRLNSSLFTISWSFGYAGINLISDNLPADERSVRQMIKEGPNPRVPAGAIF